MVRKKVRRRKYSADEEDPMAGTSNLVDVMLVLAVGFLIFVVMTANAQDVIFSDQSSQVEQGEALNSTPDIGEGVGEGYSQVGTVYKDPTTGELILIEN